MKNIGITRKQLLGLFLFALWATPWSNPRPATDPSVYILRCLAAGFWYGMFFFPIDVRFGQVYDLFEAYDKFSDVVTKVLKDLMNIPHKTRAKKTK